MPNVLVVNDDMNFPVVLPFPDDDLTEQRKTLYWICESSISTQNYIHKCMDQAIIANEDRTFQTVKRVWQNESFATFLAYLGDMLYRCNYNHPVTTELLLNIHKLTSSSLVWHEIGNIVKNAHNGKPGERIQDMIKTFSKGLDAKKLHEDYKSMSIEEMMKMISLYFDYNKKSFFLASM